MRLSLFYPLIPTGSAGIDDPTDITGLWGWWDPTDITTLFTDTGDAVGTTPVTADGDRVGVMNDKSGNTRNMWNATPNNRPTYKVNIKNGLAMLSYAPDALIDDLNTTATMSGDCTMACVIKTPGTISAATQYGIFTNFSSATFGHRIIIETTAEKFAGQTRNNDASVLSLVAPSIDTFYTLIYRANATSGLRQLWVNGTSQGTTTSAITPVAQTVRVGLSHTNNNNAFWTGHIGEAIIYNAALSDADVALLETYLNTKWSIY
jgi:hypothetical protein